MEPVYLVSNIHRSGSSMIMRCLEASGLSVVSDDKISDSLNITFNEYIPNPNGFYQFRNVIDDTFYETYKGKVIKCPIRNLITLPSGYYELLFIKRNPEEIQMSMATWTPYLSWGSDELITYFYDLYCDSLLGLLNQRGDFKITILNYKDIVNNPELEFKKINWPIDISKMIPLVDSELYRLKLEK